MGHPLLLRAEQGDVAEVERGAGRGGRELRGEVGRGREDDAHDVVVGSSSLRAKSSLTRRGLGVDLGFGVLGARDRAAQRLESHADGG